MGVFKWEAAGYRDLVTGKLLDRSPKDRRLVGVYNGRPSENPDEATRSQFGSYPQIASTYYQPDNGFNLAFEADRVRKGISPLITLTFRWGPINVEDIGNRTPAAVEKISAYITFLKALSEVDRDVPVYATIEHEPEVKVRQSQFDNKVPTYPQLAAAISYFIQRCRQEAPLVRTVAWFGGAAQNEINQILSGLSATYPPHVISFDPYRGIGHNPTSPMSSTFGAKVNWCRANSNWARLGSPPIGISETGTETGTYGHGDANNAIWWNALRTVMDAQDIEFVVFFNRASLPDWDERILPGRDPLALEAFTAQLAH